MAFLIKASFGAGVLAATLTIPPLVAFGVLFGIVALAVVGFAFANA